MASSTSVPPKPYWSWLFKRLGFDWEDASWDGYCQAWFGYFRLFGWRIKVESPSRDTKFTPAPSKETQ